MDQEPLSRPDEVPTSAYRNFVSVLSRDVPFRRLGLILVAGGIIGVGLVAFEKGRQWFGDSQRNVSQRDTAPESWYSVRMGMTRQQVAELMSHSGMRWISVSTPGMGPTPWAAHVNVVIDGAKTREMSVRFTDGQRWNYGGRPSGSDDVVEPDLLVGELDADAKLNGIRWKVVRADDDLSNDTVPIEVLLQLGLPHSQKPDIAGSGLYYFWKWPNLNALYFTGDGSVMLERPEASTAT